MASEKGYRPQTLNDLNGQPKIKKMLSVYIKAAQIKNECLDHVIVTGPSGSGKSTTAGIIANELGKKFKAYSGPTISDVNDMSEIILGIDEGDVIFIDEVHRLSRKVQEMLYFAMEQFEADVIIDGTPQRIQVPHFTLIAATNLYGGLEDAMLNRFPIQLKLAAYDDDTMAIIVKQICVNKNIKIDDESARMIGGCTRGVPRNANSYVRRVNDFALVVNDGVITPDVVREAFDFMDINEYGLNRDDMAYLKCLCAQTKAVGIDTLSVTLGVDKTTIETKIEPYMMQKGYVHKTPRGRIIDDSARQIVKQLG